MRGELVLLSGGWGASGFYPLGGFPDRLRFQRFLRVELCVLEVSHEFFRFMDCGLMGVPQDCRAEVSVDFLRISMWFMSSSTCVCGLA